MLCTIYSYRRGRIHSLQYVPEKKLSIEVGKINSVHVDAVELSKTKQCLLGGVQSKYFSAVSADCLCATIILRN